MSIAQVQTTDRNVNQLQKNIALAVNPLLSNPLLNGHLLVNVSLVNGTATINHLLNRVLIGWFITRRRGSGGSTPTYDNQDNNPTPETTLLIINGGAVSVDIYVF